jgi:D-alanyl-D-alanine carboxypeptidase/Type IV secretion system pilin
MKQYRNKINIANKILIVFKVFIYTALLVAANTQIHAQSVSEPIDTKTTQNVTLNKYSGVEGTIREFLCTPDQDTNGGALTSCINKLYRFSIVSGGLLCVFFIVFAGYQYILGGESGKKKGKDILFNSLTGLAVLGSSFVLLNFINPNITIFKVIQAPIYKSADLASCEDLGFGKGCNLAIAQPGSDFSTDKKFDGSYKACGKSFSDPNLEKTSISTVRVKVWDINQSGSKFTKEISLQAHSCVAERLKKAFTQYYNDPEKFPISDGGGYNVRNIAGTNRLSAHSFGLTFDINAKLNCHADNNGVCKVKDWAYKPCPNSGCSPYSITEASSIARAMKSNGFGWGGNWKSSKDYMHFSCTENEQGTCN